MIDIHCHILPGLDDGPQTLEEAVVMCRMAADDGITTIVATPHFKSGWFVWNSQRVFEKITDLNAALRDKRIALTILPGADITVVPELASYLGTDPYLTINKKKRYFLAELPHDTVPPQWDNFLLSLRDKGFVPILTHPERNRWFINHPDSLYGFVIRGGMVQITAMSLTGQSGPDSRELSLLLLKHNLVHVIATDAHSPDMRPPLLSAAVAAAAEVIGDYKARALVTTIPHAIIEGEDVGLSDAVPMAAIQRKKTWIQKLVYGN